MAQAVQQVSPQSATTGSMPLPIDVFAAAGDPLSARQVTRWIWILMALGALARLMRYAMRLPLWGDEAFLSASFLDRGYLDMLRPLEYHQVAPLLFLWVQLTLVKLLGFTEYSLRLFSLACSLAGLLLFRRLASRLLTGTALVVAVGVFAASYWAIRYAGEGKQYGCDLLVSLVLLTFMAEWLRRPENVRWLWGLAAIVPLAIGLSYPAMFVAGAISLTTGLVLWRSRLPRGWAPWIAWNLALGGSVLAMYFLSIKPQSTADLQIMRDYWGHIAAFPPLDSLPQFLRWLIGTHAGELLAHPLGGPRGGSTLTLVCCAAAIVALCRRRQFALLVLCLAPLALNFVAACLHRYPYAGHVRMALYLTPIVCLLTGLGAAWLLACYAARRPQRFVPWAVLAILALLALIPAGSIVRDLALPGKTPADIRARDFARWFWFEMSRDAELVCLKSDLAQDFSRDHRNFELGNSAIYLCNQRIYSPRHARREPPRWDRVSARWPLRCVEYRTEKFPDDPAAFSRWMDQMKSRYDLVAHQTYPLTYFKGRDREVDDATRVELFEFVPRGGQEDAGK